MATSFIAEGFTAVTPYLWVDGARAALVGAAERSVVTPLERPRLRFPKRSEADLVKALSKAQHAAAKAAPQVDLLHEMLRRGAADRDKETVPRWQAGYDLAMGRAAAAKVRVDGYNAMLANPLPWSNIEVLTLMRNHIQSLVDPATDTHINRIIGDPKRMAVELELRRLRAGGK